MEDLNQLFTSDDGTQVSIRPDGIHELDLRHWVLERKLRNCTIEILYCPETDEYSVGWYEQEDTEEIE